MKKELNANTGTAIFTINGEDIDINLAGIDITTFTHLALIGLHELLVKRRNPRKSYEEIRNGKLKKSKVYPPIIKAVADAFNLSLADAEAFHGSLSKERKFALRRDTRVRKALVEYEDTNELDVESWLSEPAPITKKGVTGVAATNEDLASLEKPPKKKKAKKKSRSTQ